MKAYHLVMIMTETKTHKKNKYKYTDKDKYKVPMYAIFVKSRGFKDSIHYIGIILSL